MVELIIFLPLLAGVFTGIFNKKISDKFAEYFNTLLVGTAAILSFIIFYKVVFLKVIYQISLFEWFRIGDLKVNWAIYIDSLVATMLIVVNTISALVHLYSIGYMQGDKSIPKFMAYISLFTFFMLMLVTSDNLVQLFFGWEGVGLCSYLLIGFWYQKKEAYQAAIKAFIVNRVADVFFAVGIFSIFYFLDTISFNEVFSNTRILLEHSLNLFGLEINALDFICLMLFIGCMGKSAQIGFHTWLPDAMAGPTPVSALIHAATMVTAGVFVVARHSPIFEYSPLVLEIMTFIGATTAIFAATIALVQEDIKKIIAYSTCSQLGYMFFACGVSAYSIGVFHLMTHAFFKSLLFLCSGSVIHAMSNEQNIFKMGGLWKKIPVTFSLMVIGSIAIAGIPPFAGYFSKDAILEAAFASERKFANYAYICGLIGAFCTSFYSWRLLIKVFNGSPLAEPKTFAKIHESPLSMVIPMIILSIGAIFSGVIGEKILRMIDYDLGYWNNSIKILENNNILEDIHQLSFLVKIVPLIFTLFGVAAAYIIYMYKKSLIDFLADKFSFFYKIFKNKYYIDELYNKIFVKPYFILSKFLSSKIDNNCIDLYGPNTAVRVTKFCSKFICKIQTGFLYHYAFIMISGLLIIMSWVIFIIL